MFNYIYYLNKFRDDYKKGIFSNNSVCQVALTSETKDVYKIIGIHKLTPSENVGNHNLYIDVIDETGAKIFPLIDWGWEGQKPTEIVQPLRLDKPISEPSGNLVIWGNQTIWAKAGISNVFADKIFNVHTRLADETPGNTYGHHSYYVVWMRVTKPIDPIPEPEDCEELQFKYDNLLADYEDLISELKSLIRKYE